MIVEDWATKTTKDIVLQYDRLVKALGGGLIENEVREIIAKHCPFKPGVTYMPVPRCETCAHWVSGICKRIHISPGPDFGCVQWEEKA